MNVARSPIVLSLALVVAITASLFAAVHFSRAMAFGLKGSGR